MNSYATELRARVPKLVRNHVFDENEVLTNAVFAFVEEERLRSFKNGPARGQHPRPFARKRDGKARFSFGAGAARPLALGQHATNHAHFQTKTAW